MDQKRNEINHKINMMYRQLGKMVHDDLNRDKLSVSRYKRYAGKIDTLIKTISLLDVEMDGVEEEVEAMEDREPMVTEEGFTVYRFCPACHAGNHPEAEKCVRCGADL